MKISSFICHYYMTVRVKAKNKINFRKFFHYINDFDLIILSEWYSIIEHLIVFLYLDLVSLHKTLSTIGIFTHAPGVGGTL